MKSFINQDNFFKAIGIILEKEGFTYTLNNSVLVKNQNTWKRKDSEITITTNNNVSYIELIEFHCTSKLEDNDLFLTLAHFLGYMLEPEYSEGKIKNGKGSWIFISLRDNETLVKRNNLSNVLGNYYKDIKIYFFNKILNKLLSDQSFLMIGYYYDFDAKDISLNGLRAKISSRTGREISRALILYDIFSIIFRTDFLDKVQDTNHDIICSLPRGSNKENYVTIILDNYFNDFHMLIMISAKDLLNYRIFKLDFMKGAIPIDLNYKWNKEKEDKKNKKDLSNLLESYSN